MRLARVVHGSSPQPILALERDGALYDAGELERLFDTRFSPMRIAGSSDFHTRAVALAGAGLEELDERLRTGDRPSAARLLPGSFLWLSPCDTERVHLVEAAPYDEPATEPLHRIGDARGMLGHESVVPFPPGVGAPVFELGVAAVLRDGVAGGSVEDARRAILGYAILNTWAGDAEVVHGGGYRARPVPAQLGPVLVTVDEIPTLERLRAQVRLLDAPAPPLPVETVAKGEIVGATDLDGTRFSLPTVIAWVSRWIDLRPGDVIGGGCVRRGRGPVSFGATVELAVERLGKLAGKPLLRAG